MSACRFYEAEFPDQREAVMIEIARIGENESYCKLLEYNDVEGMMLNSDLSRRRIRSVQKIVRVGKQEVAIVLRVDKKKGYIDLSKREVNDVDTFECKEKYKKSKQVHSIMLRVAKNLGLETEDLYKQFGWPLYGKYGHAYDAFRMAAANPDEVLGEFNLEPKLKEELMVHINSRMAPEAHKFRATFEIYCMGTQGIEGIRRALKAAEAMSTEKVQLKVQLIAPPKYFITAVSTRAEDIKIMEDALAEAIKVIKEEKGMLVISEGPKIVSDTEDKELQDRIELAERENAMVPDDDESDEDIF